MGRGKSRSGRNAPTRLRTTTAVTPRDSFRRRRMPASQITVVCLSGRHLFVCAVDHHDTRILDILNDPSTDLLRVHQVEAFRQDDSDRIAQLSNAVIPKSAVDCLLLCTPKHEAPLRRHYAKVQKQTRSVFVVCAGREIRGTIMLNGPSDPSVVLQHDAPTFFPIIEPNLSGLGAIDLQAAAQVALVNKNSVSLIQIQPRQSHVLEDLKRAEADQPS